jgi:photosystem II stability/assembly factor-like uncharacterized protein
VVGLRLLALGAVVLSLAGADVARGGTRAARPPRVSAPLVPNAIAFWDADRGLIATGFRYCDVGRCEGGTISLTTDGGRTSRVLLRTPAPVTWVAVAAQGHAWALTAGALLHSTDGGQTWEHLAAVVQSPSFATAEHGMGIGCGSARIRSTCPWLVATSDHGVHWRHLPSPCEGAIQGVSLVTPEEGWLLCASQPGAGNQGKSLYRTTDGGARWTRLLDVQIGGKPDGGISSYGYPQGITFAANGAGVLWESRGTLYVTVDGGQHWRGLPSVARPEIDFGSSASVVPGRAFALLSQGNAVFRLVATTRGYEGWRTVRTWRYVLRP